ncbi:hypothetical protein L1286_23485 [Pseudoalteromonas sp. SMS1]|nr:hypothetical protein [Pseudoalteromonas sp. SMS1]
MQRKGNHTTGFVKWESAGCAKDEDMDEDRVCWIYTRSGEDESWRLACLVVGRGSGYLQGNSSDWGVTKRVAP